MFKSGEVNKTLKFLMKTKETLLIVEYTRTTTTSLVVLAE